MKKERIIKIVIIATIFCALTLFFPRNISTLSSSENNFDRTTIEIENSNTYKEYGYPFPMLKVSGLYYKTKELMWDKLFFSFVAWIILVYFIITAYEFKGIEIKFKKNK